MVDAVTIQSDAATSQSNVAYPGGINDISKLVQDVISLVGQSHEPIRNVYFLFFESKKL